MLNTISKILSITLIVTLILVSLIAGGFIDIIDIDELI